jgi:hypothetical protein
MDIRNEKPIKFLTRTMSLLILSLNFGASTCQKKDSQSSELNTAKMRRNFMEIGFLNT